MSGIRWRPQAVCAATVGDIPGGIVHIKSCPRAGAPQGSFPVKWLGFVCEWRARKLFYAQKGKLIATAVTDGDVIGSEWLELGSDNYVLCMVVQLTKDDFGAFGVVDRNNWPIVLSEHTPKLTVISGKAPGKVVGFSR